jgi:hypothetical protein
MKIGLACRVSLSPASIPFCLKFNGNVTVHNARTRTQLRVYSFWRRRRRRRRRSRRRIRILHHSRKIPKSEEYGVNFNVTVGRVQ